MCVSQCLITINKLAVIIDSLTDIRDAVASGDTRIMALSRALASIVKRDPAIDLVKKADVLSIDPELSKGHNGAARDLAKRGVIEFQRKGGPRSAGTGNWLITPYGRSYLLAIARSTVKT